MKKKVLYKGVIVQRDIVKDVANRTGFTQTDVDKVLRAVFDSIKQFMYEKYEIRLYKFGAFFLSFTTSSIRKLPNGAKFFHPARFIPKFTFYKYFREQIKKIPTDDMLVSINEKRAIDEMDDE